MNAKRTLAILIVLVLVLSMMPSTAMAKGPKPPPVEESAGNNLSVPVIWSDGTPMTLPGTALTAKLTVPYTGDLVAPLPCGEGGLAYAQKVDGNVWQAESLDARTAPDPVIVNEIDWGDSLESVDMKVGTPVRVELSLYKTGVSMAAYEMVMLANPSSPDEIQGACAKPAMDTSVDPPAILPLDPAADNGGRISTKTSTEATVYTSKAKLVIQLLNADTPDVEPAWDPISLQWSDAGNPVSVSFTGELNVGGKVIYGLSTGGWKPSTTGVYRLTFFMPPDGHTLFVDQVTEIRLPLETEVTAAEEGGDVGGTAIVDPVNNLTYIDVTVIGRRR